MRKKTFPKTRRVALGCLMLIGLMGLTSAFCASASDMALVPYYEGGTGACSPLIEPSPTNLIEVRIPPTDMWGF